MSENTLRILIATDIHLGHKQEDAIVGQDSFDAFSEVLERARDIHPDFLLLGGDLFDKVNPTMATLYRCIKDIKDVVFDETIQDDGIEMQVDGYTPNYLNKNLNIKLPIFSVHGNHDFPQSMEGRSVCDLLHQSALINYIGKYTNYDKIHVEPILITKGTTTVALYAIGYINTFRMSKLFKTKNISFKDPPPNTFNIMLIHQNRYKGKRPGADYESCVHPDELPKWVNLLIWCHQHESIPKTTVEGDIPIYQPGSTVATSLIEAEAEVKHIVLVSVTNKKCDTQPIFLTKSYRPMLIQKIEMEELAARYPELSWEQFLLKETTALFEQFERETKKKTEKQGKNKSKKLPLVRFKVEHSGFNVGKANIILEKNFSQKVANPNEVFKFWKRRQVKPQPQITDEEVMKAFKQKTDIYATSNQLENQIGKRIRIQFKREGFESVLCHLDQVLENAICKDKKPENDVFETLSRRVCQNFVGKTCQQTNKFCEDLGRQYKQTIDYHLEAIKFNLGQTGIEPKQTNLMTGSQYEMKINIKDKELESGFERGEFCSGSGQKIRVNSSKDLDDNQKCCSQSDQPFQKGTEANFQVALGMASESQQRKKLKNVEVPKRKPRTKKASKSRKGSDDEEFL